MTFLATDEQLDAINTIDTNCIVTAGAGSGKTFVLVERYLKIIEEYSISNLDIIEEIVAITFTEKAAKEMKDRIRKEMSIRKMQSLNDNLPDKALMWNNNMQKMEYANISTFHSFCAKILREFPIEADLDPEYNVLDSTETAWIIQEVVENELKKILEKKKSNSLLYKWVGQTGFERSVTQLINVYHQISNTGLNINEVCQLTSDNFEHSPYELIKGWDNLISLGDELYYGEGNSTKLKTFQENWVTLKEQLIISINNADSIEKILSTLDELTSGNFGSTVKEQRKKVNEQINTMKELVESIKYHQSERDYLIEFYLLLDNIKQTFKKEKERINALDFDDLLLRVIELLKKNKDVRDQIYNRISFLMIDEFQDSNQIQKELIELLLEDDQNKINQGALFVVGDPKQSVYRFRGADVSVFKKMEQKISQTSGKIKSMQKNFRSVSEIIDFINFFFSETMSKEFDSPNYYEKAIPINDNQVEGSVEFIPIYLDDDKNQTVHEKEAKCIAKRIEELISNNVEPNEVAILFRSMSKIKIYEQELVKKEIPYYIVGGRGFFQKQEIYDLINVLEYLLDNTNRIAMSGILRSPMVALTDDTLYKIMAKDIWCVSYEQWETKISNIKELEKNKLKHFYYWITSIKQIIGRAKVSEIIERIIEITNYKAILLAHPSGIQAVANIEKFIRLARENNQNNPYSVFDFLQKINRLIEDDQQETEAAIESESSNTIKLMTIHQSKGLQFSYVFVPDLSRKSLPDDSLLKFSSVYGLTCRVPSDNDEWLYPIRWLTISNEDKKLEQEESARVLYVAMTRAKVKLILSGKVENTKEKFEKENVLKADSWSKWFDIIMQYNSINLEDRVWQYQSTEKSHGNINIILHENEDLESLHNCYSSSNNILNILEKNNTICQEELNIINYSIPIVVPDADRVYSISAIKRYLSCPRYYYYIDVLTLSGFRNWIYDEFEEMNLNSNKLSPASKGVIVHQLLDRFTNYPEEITDWEIYFHMYLTDKNLIGTMEISNFKEEVNVYINNYKKSQFFKTSPNDVKTEFELILNLNNGKIMGVIDRLDIFPDGTFTIIDYKTDKLINKEQYSSQIRTYALAVNKIFGLKPASGLLYFIRHDIIEEIEIDNNILCEWEAKLEKILSILNKSTKFDEFEANRDYCDICDFQLLCNKF